MDTKRLYFFMGKGLSPLSNFIRRYQYGNTYTHAGLVLDMENIYNPQVLAAVEEIKIGSFWKVHRRARQELFKYYYVNVTEQQYKMVMEKIDMYNLSKYDVTGLLSFYLKINVNKEDRYFCSELVFDIMKTSGIEILNDTKAYEVHPSILIKSPLVKEDVELNKKLWEYYGWNDDLEKRSINIIDYFKSKKITDANIHKFNQ